MNGRRTWRLGFAGQFLAFGLIVLVGGMVTIGFWIQREITDAVINRTAGVTSLYVNAMLGAVFRVTIADNGPGFDPATVTDNGAQGLVGMRERVEMLGGWVEIDTEMDRGTTVTASVSLHDE